MLQEAYTDISKQKPTKKVDKRKFKLNFWPGMSDL